MFLLTSLLVFVTTNGQNLTITPESTDVNTGSTFSCSGIRPIDLTNSIFLALDFDYENNIAYIEMRGPSDQYYAIGFGNNVMLDTYTIVISGLGAAQERKLGI